MLQGRWSDFGRELLWGSDHGPVSLRRVGQAVDLPVKARRGGHDLRGSPQSGWLKSRSRPPRPRRVSPPGWLRPPSGRRLGVDSSRRSYACASGRVGPRATATTIRPLSVVQSVVGLHRWGSHLPPCPCWNVAAACGDGRAARPSVDPTYVCRQLGGNGCVMAPETGELAPGGCCSVPSSRPDRGGGGVRAGSGPRCAWVGVAASVRGAPSVAGRVSAASLDGVERASTIGAVLRCR